jgi:hypothetical protein
VNTVSNPEGFQSALDMFESVAEDYTGVANFAWVDSVFNPAKRLLLGFHAIGKYPRMAAQRIQDEIKIPFPENWVINPNSIREFTNDYINLTVFEMQYSLIPIRCLTLLLRDTE